jgi:protein-disulfide isomerase
MAEKKDQEVIEINVQAWMVPLSILVAGALIAGGLYFGLNGKDNGGTKNNDTNNAADGTNNGPFSDSSIVAATASIDNDPYLGDRSKAKYAIVEFSDYECPFCKRHDQEVYPDIKKNYMIPESSLCIQRSSSFIP